MYKLIVERLGVLTDEVSGHFEEALDWAIEQGLKHVEVRVINGHNVITLNDDQAKEVRRQVEARGLFISAMASPLFKCALDGSRLTASGDTFGQKEEDVDAHFAKLDRAIQLAKLLGTTRIRVFSFWREAEPLKYKEDIVSRLRRAAEIAQQEGVQLLLENEPSCNGGFAEEVAEIVRGIDSPALRGLWDPGNEAYGGREAFPAGYSFMKDALAHIHLKDAYMCADGTARCVPLGSGSVPVIAHLKALLADGYEGLFTIETHYIPEGGSQMTGTRMTLDALRALLSEV
ncbi:sugar phosphate isomerase/epimerase family protein [Paenibacillus alba]|uniref:Sugar phosphate isomerase/epimerase n=1 Tax=Paenibacillus alba TaxID=1197127 RepID=A0ABU6FZP0_9BACL|nr:sugar phosphate isomerase/epimerase family protein [Paenibacillus alba]MEC0227373.1 sugar phosphate isomerase/epimerase [Paenibacillus alba]